MATSDDTKPPSTASKTRGEVDVQCLVRLCVICGARVINRNPKTQTCSPPCTTAKELNITRERSIRMFGNAGRPCN